MEITIRKGIANDINAALLMVKELATYEKAPNEVEVTIQEMKKEFTNNTFDFFVAEINTEIIGIALYYYKYSTWKGKCIFLEDIIVTEKYRNKGVGKLLFDAVTTIAKQEQVRRLEWQVLNWNAPAITFYKKFNANFDDEWINCKLTYHQLQNT